MKDFGDATRWATGLYISPMMLEPITKSEVPSNAVNIRKMKKVARFGARAVAAQKTKKRVTDATYI